MASKSLANRRDGKTMKIAMQMYTFREKAAKDLLGALSDVKEAGYDGVEFGGLYGHEAARVRAHLDGIGLAAVSRHVSLEDLADNPQGAIETCKALGCRFIVLSGISEARRRATRDFREIVGTAGRAARLCRDAGLKLAYHNNDLDFKFPGNSLETMLDAIPELDAQIDTGWLALGGGDPVALLNKYTGRYQSVHLKEYLPGSTLDAIDFCPMGAGLPPCKPICEAGARGGAQWLIADQDDDAHRPVKDAARISAAYLRSLGV
jgi:sugar phosphate isomerase/epimerase